MVVPRTLMERSLLGRRPECVPTEGSHRDPEQDLPYGLLERSRRGIEEEGHRSSWEESSTSSLGSSHCVSLSSLREVRAKPRARQASPVPLLWTVSPVVGSSPRQAQDRARPSSRRPPTRSQRPTTRSQ